MSDNSDSDDTDILLLIPPSYYITNAEGVLQKAENVENILENVSHQLPANETVKEIGYQEEKHHQIKPCSNESGSASIEESKGNTNLLDIKNPCDLLSKACQNTLQEINSRRSDWRQLPVNCSFENISDISSVSGCQQPIKCLTNVTRNQRLSIRESILLHSTPRSEKIDLDDHVDGEVSTALLEDNNEINSTLTDKQIYFEQENGKKYNINTTKHDLKDLKDCKECLNVAKDDLKEAGDDINIVEGHLHQPVENSVTSSNLGNTRINLNNAINDYIDEKGKSHQNDTIDRLSNIGDPIQINKDRLNYCENLLYYLQSSFSTDAFCNKKNFLSPSNQEIMSATKLPLKSNCNRNQQTSSSSSLNHHSSHNYHCHHHNYDIDTDNEKDHNHANMEENSNFNTDDQGLNITPTFTNDSVTEERLPRYVASTNTPVDYFVRYSSNANDRDKRNDCSMLRKNDNPNITHNHIKHKDNNVINVDQCKGNFNRENECRSGSLISLGKIWANKDSSQILSSPMINAVPSVGVIEGGCHAAMQEDHHLMEEQLRRQHLEKTVKDLQSNLLEYQQRISVAIEVDKSKDEALQALRMEKSSLFEDLQATRQHLSNAEERSKRFEDRLSHLQKELSQAIALSAKFQDKIEKLELESTQNSNKYHDTCQQYKQEIDEISIKLEACKRSEESLINEMQKLKDKYVKSQHLYEKAKLRADELQKENDSLKHQKDALTDYHQKQKARADHLESQKASLQVTVSQLTQVEASLKRKLELQQKSLKSHYQVQLENVVAQKHREFQEQFERHESEMIAESKDRERLIADRAIKQIELIGEKNNLEIQLLQEKHNEECELYRIQLENATKTIEQLENELQSMKRKRAVIAEKLHNVMEVQWQKALEILTSPNQTIAESTNESSRTDSGSPEINDGSYKDTKNDNSTTTVNNYSSTPKSNKKQNNLNVQSCKSAVISPVDKLQAYIELLLDKSPDDFDRFDDILTLSTKIKQAKEKLEKNGRKQNRHNKPPWKG